MTINQPLNIASGLVYLYVNLHMGSSMPSDTAELLSIDYLEPILKYCKNCGISEEDALADTSLLKADERASRDYLLLADVEQLLANMTARLPVTPYQMGLLLGVSFSASSHGQLGFVGLCSRNFDEALRHSSRFITLVSPLFDIKYQVEDDLAVIEIHELQPLPDNTYSFILGLFLGGIRSMSLSLLGTRLFNYHDKSIIELTIDESQIDAAWRDAMGPMEFRYGSAVNKIVFDKELVFLDLPSASEASLATVLAVCDQRLAALDKKRKAVENPVTQKVLAYLASASRPYPTLDDVAEKFCVSPRTLHRQLQKESTSYSRVLTQFKVDRAKELLQNLSLTIKEIAYELDYSDVSNFSAAFKKATSTTPTQFRDAIEET